MTIYAIVFICLIIIELAYFEVADKFNIIDRPNERSSHSTIVLRGGGIIFMLGAVLWSVIYGFAEGSAAVMPYLPFLIGLVLVATTSFIDDIRSLPDSLRLVVQFVSMVLMFFSLDMFNWVWWWIIVALIVCVGITNVYNFMDGINGITGGYSLVVLLSLFLMNQRWVLCSSPYTENSLIITVILADLVFCFFNFRPKGKAKCFAGDVGSVGIAFIVLFILGSLIFSTGDVTYLLFLVVYGIDACLTICHRIMLRENLGQAHRKHAFQIMANELKMGHLTVSLIYMALQALISAVFIFVVPSNAVARWVYLVVVVFALALAYVIFIRKYYHLHEEYLETLDYQLKDYK